jgi:bifunctional non-homologous end joining protein LigD
MKATLGTLPPDDGRWAFEVKFDGYRTLAFVDADGLRLQSSNLLDVTGKYPELASLPGSVLPRRAVLDGELVVLDDEGRPRFELLQQHQRQAVFLAFDLLSVDEHDTVSLPYEDRRRLLQAVVEPGPNWSVPSHRVGGGAGLLAAARQQGLEGVMAKRLGSTYTPGARSKEWRKVKVRHEVEVVIGGYTGGEGSRSSTFGALLVGRRDGSRLAFAGGVGTGFTQRLLEHLLARLEALRVEDCPFDPLPPAPYRRGAVWVRPELSARIEITEFTNVGLVRQSSFVDLVTDQSATPPSPR